MSPPVPIRWLLVRDPRGELDPQAFLATDLEARPQDILAWFVRRWQVEVTFEEVRAHLGVETQRQWSDKAILRSTPALLGLFSIVTLFAHELCQITKAQTQDGRMVSEGSSDLQRRNRRRTPRNLGASDFFHVTAAPRPYRNSAAHLAAHAKRPRIRRLDRPNSS